MRYFISREGTGARKNIWAHWSNTEGIYICGNADVIESSITTVDQLELGDVDEVDDGGQSGRRAPEAAGPPFIGLFITGSENESRNEMHQKSDLVELCSKHLHV